MGAFAGFHTLQESASTSVTSGALTRSGTSVASRARGIILLADTRASRACVDSRSRAKIFTFLAGMVYCTYVYNVR